MQKHNFVLPDFQNSIVNVASTMAEFLGNKKPHPTLPKLLEKLQSNHRNVIFFVIDGMGTKILEKHLPANSFLRRHQIQTVTSVFPSTTASATTSLVTGITPAEHGWLGWTLNFDGAVVELFRGRNFYTEEFLPDRDFVRKNRPYQTFWESKTLSRKIFTCMPEISYKYPTQNQILYRSTKEMLAKIHKTCLSPDPKFIYAYFPDLDSFMHHTGTRSKKVRHFVRKLDRTFAKFCKQQPDTLCIITADHGQIDAQGYTYFCDDQELLDCLLFPPAWDFRAISFYVKSTHHEKFKKVFRKYEKDFALFSTQEIIKQGILGDFSKNPENQKFCGDYIAIGTDTCKLAVLKKPDNLKKLHRGTHSGLTADEMLVPVIVATGKE